MQATLLSIAIALILALVAALVGPHFVDWNKYRGQFETTASRMTGLDVRIAGPIEARLLPVPTLMLTRIDAVRPGDAGSLRARRLNVEFSLGALVRGEWKATDVRLDGAEIAINIDRDGRLDWPAPSIGFDPETISVERLDIRDSRALLYDAASGSGLLLDQFEFKGELRTLAGPVKGGGSFYIGNQHYPYRVTAGRTGDDRVRVRLNADPIDFPRTFDADVLVSVENGAPRYEGTLTVVRPVGRAAGPQGHIIEPWRLTGKVKGTSSAAVIEQVEFQYGPDERAIRLRGDANLSFGRTPELKVVLSSSQVDLDRILSVPEEVRRRPLVAIKSVADTFAGTQRMAIPVRLGVSIESLTLAGATLQRVNGDFKSEPDGWDIEALEFRAPGFAQVALAGRFSAGAGDSIAFDGRTRVEAQDPRALIAWLTDRADAQTIAATSLRVEGDIRFASNTIAVERLKADLDRMTLEGRLAYWWAGERRPARIEAVLSAPEFDLDRAQTLAQGLFAGTAFDVPSEGIVSAKIGRATVAGVEASRADVNVRFDGDGVQIERLTIGDFGGAALTVKGSVDTRAQVPRGALNLELDAKKLDGVATLIEKISPESASELRRNAARLQPAKLAAALTFGAGGAAQSLGRFRIDGTAGVVRIGLQGDLAARSEDLNLAGLPKLRSSALNLSGRIESGDGSALLSLLGLGGVFAVDNKRPGRLDLTARGSLDGDLALDGRMFAGGLDIGAKGKLRLAAEQGPTGALAVTVTGASLRRSPENLPIALTTQLALAGSMLDFSEIAGKVAGTAINGRLRVGLSEGLAEPVSLHGDLAFGGISLPAVIGAAIGATPAPREARGWSSEPFEPGVWSRSAVGDVRVRFGQVALTPALRANDVAAVVRLDRGVMAFERIDGSLAGGRVAGSMTFRNSGDGLALESQLRIAGADVTALVPAGAGLSGRATVSVSATGTGRSPIALIGGLAGEGTFTLQDARIARLSAGAFDAVTRSVDQGLPIDTGRIGGRLDTALGAGPLTVPLAQGEISVAAGQVRLVNSAVRAERADLAVGGSYDLAANAVDARLTLTGSAIEGTPDGFRPEATVTVRGPLAEARRTLDATSFTNLLALRLIEEKARKIDELEAGREKPASEAPAAPVKPEASAPSALPAGPKPPAPEAPATAVPTAPLAPALPPANEPATAAVPASPPSSAPPLTRPAAPPGTQPPRPPAAVPAPPTDIRPIPPPQRQSQPSRPAAESRSWLERLLGP